MFNENDFFNQLREQGIEITQEQQKKIRERLDGYLTYVPKVGIFGKTGVGKSSLCNALFGQDLCPTSDVEACTRGTQDVLINFGSSKGIQLLDVPGVGESEMRDDEYSELYAKLLPELDMVLWLIKGDDRALAVDERFYKTVVKPHLEQGKPFFFVLNQVDKIEPFREWDEAHHEPGPKQFLNIDRKIKDVANSFGVVSSSVVAVSANEKYNLTELVDRMVFALPKEKNISFFRNVSQEFQTKKSTAHVKKGFFEIVAESVGSVVEKVGDVIDKIGNAFAKIGSAAESFFSHISPGCYITTAICEHDGKSDDCYELMQFRRFRDEWLVNQPGGKAIVAKYYKTAPGIVERINRLENRDGVYDEIKAVYLDKCLNFIEANEMEKCRELYTQMVTDLSGRFLDGQLGN